MSALALGRTMHSGHSAIRSDAGRPSALAIATSYGCLKRWPARFRRRNGLGCRRPSRNGRSRTSFAPRGVADWERRPDVIRNGSRFAKHDYGTIKNARGRFAEDPFGGPLREAQPLPVGREAEEIGSFRLVGTSHRRSPLSVSFAMRLLISFATLFIGGVVTP